MPFFYFYLFFFLSFEINMKRIQIQTFNPDLAAAGPTKGELGVVIVQLPNQKMFL